VAALFLVSNARADEYTKMTYLTFSGPVQLPGISLPGGTYMFKLADPDTGRRVLQVWDKDGMKLYTTLLTIPDERMEASDQPVVMFSERPAGQPQAIKSWFYPDERIGQEFVYPKSQATQIARENHASVLSFSDDSVKDNDAAAMHTAKIGRIDENGQVAEASKAADNRANDSTAPSNGNAAQASPNTQSASTTAAPAAATTAADNDDAASTTTKRAGAATARADNDQNRAPAPAPSANRTQSSAAVGTSGTTAQSSTAPQSSTATQSNTASQSNTAAQSNTASQSNTAAKSGTAPRSDRAVGTSGTAANPQRPNNSNRANQSDRGSNSAAPNRTLPRTASPLASLELLSALSLLGGLSVHQLRKRTADTRV